jgi:hemoglobin
MKSQIIRFVVCFFVACVPHLLGCANSEEKDRDFFTSGSREADQRAEQRVAKVEQLRGENSEKKEESSKKGDEKKSPIANATVKKTLFARLGGDEGVNAIVEDFVPRALADPRVNWERKGVTRGGMNVFKRSKSVAWNPSGENAARLKKHLAQFLALSTGGPPTYEGRDMREVHGQMHITNAEFDAAVGDLKASLDKIGVPTEEQKELLSIIESTRPQVVTKR